MNILSIIYSIPAVPYSSSSMYSAMTDSTTTLTLMSDSSTPLTPTPRSSPSPSPSSDLSPLIPQSSDNPNGYQSHQDEQTTYEQEFLGPEVVNSAMFPLDASGSSLPPTSHPYAIQYDPPQPLAPSVAPVRRSSTIPRRTRASSSLPPPPPPPSTSLPPAPTGVMVEPLSNTSSSHRQSDGRTLHHSDFVGHGRTGSSGLEVLTEEYDDGCPEGSKQAIDESDSNANAAPRNEKHDSHPLPPLPSPPTGSQVTARNPPTPTKLQPPSPHPSNIVAPRPRGTSQLTTRSEMANHPPFIHSTTQGTIFQRRAKMSAPPSSRSTSPADSTASAGSISQPKSAASSLPGITTAGIIPGRSRSSSQPGRRPSLVSGRISPLGPRPPLPGTTNVNESAMRKLSITSKFNPSGQPSQLSIQTDLPPLQIGSTALSLVPPPPAFTSNLPTNPSSPLPQTPPTDPLLKPYHMMSLLRNTMISTTGGYVTRRLHVPHEVWSQGGAKLSNVLDKVRVTAILCSALEDLQNSSSEHFGAGNVSSGLAMGIGSIGRKEADAWLTKLEDFSSVCDGVVTNFGKKLGVGEGFVLKKTTWGDKLTRSFDKFTNGKK